METARKGKFKERPQNSHLCELARNEICKKINSWNLQGTEFARNGINKEWGWNLQRMDFARNAYAYSLNRLLVQHSSVDIVATVLR